MVCIYYKHSLPAQGRVRHNSTHDNTTDDQIRGSDYYTLVAAAKGSAMQQGGHFHILSYLGLDTSISSRLGGCLCEPLHVLLKTTVPSVTTHSIGDSLCLPLTDTISMENATGSSGSFHPI